MIRYTRLPADILDHLKGIPELLRADGRVVFAYLFGGLAREGPRPLSDVDIAVFLREPVSNVADTKMSIFDSISDLLGTSEIDLVILNNSPISLTGRILQTRKVLLDTEPFVRHRFESLKLREYSDFHIKERTFFERRYSHG